MRHSYLYICCAKNHFSDGWHGKDAADAMHHTNSTMEAFRSLGRNGWDASGTDANVTVHAALSGTNSAFFSLYLTTHTQQGAVITPRTTTTYALGAALDVIAHEWGHGVVFTSAGLPYDDFLYPQASQLHEGFSDVIGHIVEKMMQPGGFGLEKSSDWHFGEDAFAAGNYVRSASTDDGAGPFRYHRDDTSGGATHHNWGNMLSVAFYVLSDGATNPWCASNPNAFGCNAATSGLGQDAAARVMFRALTHYVTSTAEWEDIADKVKLAAADLYHNCYASENRNAEWEQEQVEQAFLSIGYPSGLGSFEFCPIIPEW